jgi:AcrR family transcriptional regulator
MPMRTDRSVRAQELVAAARVVLEKEGRGALTMRRLGDELGIRAPSIYKHFVDKGAVEAAVIEDVFAEIGTALHDSVATSGRGDAVTPLLTTYRAFGVDHPNLYRLATSGPLDRDAIAPGIEDWAGEPFFLATGDPHRAQALWSFAHGMVILEIDDRFADTPGLDHTWRAGADAFAR